MCSIDDSHYCMGSDSPRNASVLQAIMQVSFVLPLGEIPNNRKLSQTKSITSKHIQKSSQNVLAKISLSLDSMRKDSLRRRLGAAGSASTAGAAARPREPKASLSRNPASVSDGLALAAASPASRAERASLSSVSSSAGPSVASISSSSGSSPGPGG